MAEFFVAFLLIVAIVVAPVMIAARIVRAQNTGFWHALFALILQGLLSQLIGHYVANSAVSSLLSVVAGAGVFALVLNTTFLRGLAVSAIVVALTVAIAIVAAMFLHH